MTANPKVAHYPENMHITPVSSGLRRLLAPALLLALPVLMTACGGGKATRPAPPPPTANWPKTVPDNPEAANSVLMRAISLVGTPYRYGGNTPDSGFDCSGLVAYVYREMLDLKLPRTSRDLAAVQGPKIDPQRLATGDLVFFGSRGSVTHEHRRHRAPRLDQRSLLEGPLHRGETRPSLK